MALSRWLTVSETQIANLNKTSIVAISDASIGLARFYEHCVKKMTLSDNGRVWDEPSDEDLQRIEQEEYDNLIPFPTKDTIH
jgi:hypothetical protein